MLRVTVRGQGIPQVVIGSGEVLAFGRAPDGALPADDVDAQLRFTVLALPRVASHVSRLTGEIAVSGEVVRLRWRGTTEAQLSSLFDAPGGARRVALSQHMTALLDEGENTIVILRGRRTGGTYADLILSVDVEVVEAGPVEAASVADPEGVPTAPAPALERWSREWYVALALAEPWLTGGDDYPRPASNREIYERILAWRGHAWNLERSQRVDDAIRAVARLAFGSDDPFGRGVGRVQNARFSVGRRAAEVQLVTAADLAAVRMAQTRGAGLNPERSGTQGLGAPRDHA